MAVTMVTGGLGFIGRLIVSELVENGDRVVSYNRDYSQASHSDVVCEQGELFDIPRLLEVIRIHQVEKIIHTAAMSHPDLSIRFPIGTIAANITGSAHLFEAARVSGVSRIVNFSSESVYGHHKETMDRAIDETTILRPTTPYGVTKAAVEMLAEVYNAHYSMDIISLRVTEVYGPGNTMPQLLYDMIRSSVDGVPYRLPQGGEQRYQFIYALDVVQAAIKALTCQAPTQSSYNITGGREASVYEAAAIIEELLPGSNFEIGPGVMGRDLHGPFDISNAQSDLGYVPAWSLEIGLQTYVSWLNESRY